MFIVVFYSYQLVLRKPACYLSKFWITFQGNVFICTMALSFIETKHKKFSELKLKSVTIQTCINIFKYVIILGDHEKTYWFLEIDQRGLYLETKLSNNILK